MPCGGGNGPGVGVAALIPAVGGVYVARARLVRGCRRQTVVLGLRAPGTSNVPRHLDGWGGESYLDEEPLTEILLI